MPGIKITPRDPLIARDGRPFGAEGGSRMYSLDWFYPSTLAGSVRTMLGKLMADDQPVVFDPAMVQRLKNLAVKGPFPLVKDRLYYPAPKDAVLYEKEDEVHIMKLKPIPLQEGEGCDLPHPELWPIAVTEDVKPVSGPLFWSQEKLEQWLSDEVEQTALAIPRVPDCKQEDYLYGFERDIRVHVRIDPATFRSEEGQLFTTTSLAFPVEPQVMIGAMLDAGGDTELHQAIQTLNMLHPFGGERRLAAFEHDDNPYKWEPSRTLIDAFTDAKGLRMVLATPAIFQQGWLPDWIDGHRLEGEPPSGKGLRLRLRGACVDRWKPISGWSLEERTQKPVRRMVPAGSVYFFEVLDGQPSAYIRDLWLQSVCGDSSSHQRAETEQDRKDGFGLAVWGRWNMSD